MVWWLVMLWVCFGLMRVRGGVGWGVVLIWGCGVLGCFWG